MARSGRHLAKKADYGTAPWIVAGARAVMGSIDLDPATTPRWNTVVRATHILTKRDNALKCRWPTVRTALTNAPGDPAGVLVPAFWWRLVEQWLTGVVECATWVGFSLSQFRTLLNPRDEARAQAARVQLGHGAHPLLLPTLIPRTRVAYNELVAGRPTRTKHPSHDTYVTLLPPLERRARRAMVARWCQVFAHDGLIINGG